MAVAYGEGNCQLHCTIPTCGVPWAFKRFSNTSILMFCFTRCCVRVDFINATVCWLILLNESDVRQTEKISLWFA